MDVPAQSGQSLPLSEFPSEVIDLITLSLSQQSATSFARVCKAFNQHSERSIWRTLAIPLNANFGRCPTIGEDTIQCDSWEYEWEVRQRYVMGLISRVGEILLRSDHRRIGMVEEVILDPLPQASAVMVMLLHKVASTIRCLKVAESPDIEERYDQCLESLLFGTDIHFPCLTYIHLGVRSVRHIGIIPFLTTSAPNLSTLEIELDTFNETEDTFLHGFPPSSTLGKLRVLRIVVEDYLYLGDLNHLKPIVDLITFSPVLEQASICNLGDVDTCLVELLMKALSTRPILRDLQWEIPLELFTDCQPLQSDPGFPALQRLVLSEGCLLKGNLCMSLLSFYTHALRLPVLSFLSLDEKAPTTEPRSTAHLPPPIVTHSLPPQLPYCLSQCPCLTTIHTTIGLVGRGELGFWSSIDNIMSTGNFTEISNFTGSIRSFYNDTDAVLYHLCVSTLFLEVCDQVASSLLLNDADESHPIIYTHEDGSERERIYQLHSQVSVQNLTFYQGYDVPMSIITSMEELGGYGGNERSGRDLQVGEDGWGILRNWYNGEKSRREGLEGHPAEHSSIH